MTNSIKVTDPENPEYFVEFDRLTDRQLKVLKAYEEFQKEIVTAVISVAAIGVAAEDNPNDADLGKYVRELADFKYFKQKKKEVKIVFEEMKRELEDNS